MDDATQKIAMRVREYLDVREEVVPEVNGERFDTIHDIDNGSRGHFRLLASDVRALVDALEAAQRPLVSPEQREAMEWAGIKALVESAEVPTGVRARLLGEAFTIREAVDAETVVQVILDAILARFTIPVLDVEKVARLLYSFDPEIQMWNGEPYVYSEPGAKSQRKRARKWAKRLVEALPTLTADTEKGDGRD